MMLDLNLEEDIAKEFNKNMYMKLVLWMSTLSVIFSKLLVMNLEK